MKLNRGFAIFGLVAAFAVAMASFTVNADGTGFVGKGNVQDAYSWDDHDLQANGDFLSFRYVTSGTTQFDCEWWTGPTNNRKYHRNTYTVENSSSADLMSSVRRNPVGHITGFNLDGWAGDGPSSGSGSVTCPTGDGNHMKSIVPGTVVSLGGTSELQVTADGTNWFAVPQSDE